MGHGAAAARTLGCNKYRRLRVQSPFLTSIWTFYLLKITKAFQDSIEGVIVIGSFLGEVEVGRDGETKYKIVFEIEATEETVQAAQQEEEITRMNNSLVLSVSSTKRRPGLRAASLSPLVLTLFPICAMEIHV